MTHHTDAEQLHQLLELVLTELDRKAIPIAYMQEIDRKGKAFIEQAARRAPAAPVQQGWKQVPIELLERIQESLGSFISDQGWSQSDMDTADALDGVLAAAPQPPETVPENIREGAPYDNLAFEQLARDMGVWGTPQAALCAQFWLTAQGRPLDRQQIQSMIDQHVGLDSCDTSLHHLARAVEHAHGIQAQRHGQ
ncbi:hypothetical protein N5D37_05250 [Comamonas aquatica]|uniref:hypothetical protein n=1 Tax=Comamonas aquatica TaxID=225991 RepID=UPI002446AFCE|nr:hypothetical protein [Comamonas aquatica]MDH1765114.1 hypothetical protein [Comamonas aquatica]